MLQFIIAYLIAGVGFTGFFMDDFFEEVRKELDARLWYWPPWIMYAVITFIILAWPWFATDTIQQMIQVYKTRKRLRALAKEFDKILKDLADDELDYLRFHTDWNWLHPVISKVYHYSIRKEGYTRDQEVLLNQLQWFTFTGDIDKVFELCSTLIDFINTKTKE